MDNQAEIYKALVKTRDKLNAIYLMRERNMLRLTPAVPELIELLQRERHDVISKMTKRIEAHPLHKKLSGK